MLPGMLGAPIHWDWAGRLLLMFDGSWVPHPAMAGAIPHCSIRTRTALRNPALRQHRPAPASQLWVLEPAPILAMPKPCQGPPVQTQPVSGCGQPRALTSAARMWRSASCCRVDSDGDNAPDADAQWGCGAGVAAAAGAAPGPAKPGCALHRGGFHN